MAPEFDPKDDVSYEDRFITFRVLAFSVAVIGAGYLVHTKMSKLLKHKRET
jgi:hypothetical protein